MQGLVRVYKAMGNGDIKTGRKRLFELAGEIERLEKQYGTEEELIRVLEDRLYSIIMALNFAWEKGKNSQVKADLKELAALLCFVLGKGEQ